MDITDHDIEEARCKVVEITNIVLYTVDKGLHGQNVLSSVVIDWICYIQTQDQFTSCR